MEQTGEGGRRKALLVIHGIGRQRPLRALGYFVQGLVRAGADAGARPAAGAGGARPAPAILEVAGRPRLYVRVPGELLGAGTGAAAGSCPGDVDVFEYHWAEHSVGRMGALATFGWLLEVTLAGLDFRRQLEVRGSGRAAGAIARQLVQVVGLLAVTGLMALAVLVVLARLGEARLALAAALRSLPGFPTPGTAAALVLLLCLAAATSILARDLARAAAEARAARRASPRGSDWAGLNARAASRWRRAGVPALLLLGVATAAVAWWLSGPLAGYGDAFGALLREPAIVVAALAVAAGVLLHGVLVTHVSDVALYVTSDRVSSRARTRRAILDEGEALLEGLLTAGYDAVYLAGHSLGSVISLDLLDRLARKVRAEPNGEPGEDVAGAELSRLAGLLTFGSPLDKVAHFFQVRPRESEAVRAQLLGFLHGVRRQPDERDFGPYALVPRRQPFRHVRWLQVHAPADPLSDRLAQYTVDTRLLIPRYNPLTAHNSYWHDRYFYGGVLEWLAGPPEPPREEGRTGVS